MSSTLTENTSLVPVTSIGGSSTLKPIKVVDKVPISPWMWLAVTCVILSVSGGIRFWRDRQFRTLARDSATCPFPLSELPRALGTWHAEEGMDSQLDPEISGIAGSSADLVREYKDSKTGETAKVLVLYGAADSVFAHTPDVCYPSAGFGHVIPPADRELTTSTSPKPVAFRTSYFTKKEAGLPLYVEVFCTFRHNGKWLPDVTSRWKMFRSHPSMFKIQIQRQTLGLTTEDSPIDSLLKVTVEAIDRRLNEKDTLASANARSFRD
jgi:Protein of unknown function (DUF3485)